MHCVFFIFTFSERAARGGDGGALPDFFFSPGSAEDHERDWPPSKKKLVFFGLATSTLNVRNNDNNNNYTVDPMLLPSGNPFKCH